ARLPAATGATFAVDHRPAGEDPGDRHPHRRRVRQAEPAGSAEAAGRRAAPGEARDRPRRFQDRDPAAELSMPADDIVRERLGTDGFSTSDFRDNHRIVVPAEKLYAALEALKDHGG